MLRIGLFPNEEKAEVMACIKQVISKINAWGFQVVIPAQFSSLLPGTTALDGNCWAEQIDIALAIGGDGTMIKNARELSGSGIPICGINLGRLGFLNEIELDNIDEYLRQLYEGRYHIEERLMIKAIVYRDGEICYSGEALNDAVIAKLSLSRLLRLKVYINGQLIEKYPADGVIVSTPTGSTGYALSAGGPIINPVLKVLTITPICPHLLHARSLIIPAEERVAIRFESTDEQAMLTLDGQTDFMVMSDDSIEIVQAERTAKFIKFFQGKTFYETVRTKLKT